MPARRVTAAISYKDLPAPMAVKAPFARQGWIFELKYDGFRVLAGKHGENITLVSRRGTNLLPNYPELEACLRALPDLVCARSSERIRKRADAAYPRGRTSGWVKIKTGVGRAIDEERAKWNE